MRPVNGNPNQSQKGLRMGASKKLNMVFKHVFICSNPYIYNIVVQSPKVDDVEGLVASTKNLELLKQKHLE